MRQLAAQLKEKYPRIDVLANNAGGIMGQRELTVDGHEKTFQINHLAPFLLTTELMDVLTASHATVINTSSAANALRQAGPLRPRHGQATTPPTGPTATPSSRTSSSPRS